MSVQEIKETALKLSPEEREWLAEELLASIDAEEDISPEFKALLDRRFEEMVSGKVKGIPAEEAFAEARRRLEMRAERHSTSSS